MNWIGKLMMTLTGIVVGIPAAVLIAATSIRLVVWN